MLCPKQCDLYLYYSNASETWVLKETIIQKLSVFERRILRRILGPTKNTKYRESRPMKN
jgi:hypothetical protein